MAGIIITWPGTLATIPTGWGLCDGNGGRPNLLDKYLKSVGASENPGTTGGATTHTHTSPAHGHTQDAHTHSGTSAASGTQEKFNQHAQGSIAIDHTHSLTLGATTATNQTTAVSLGTAPNDPPYYKIAFIYDSLISKYPIGSIILWNSATPPLGWSVCDGSGGTPDLRNKFLKSVGSGEDPGGTGGSSDAHTHTADNHNHTQDSHTHTGSHGTASAAIGSYPEASTYSSPSHSHSPTISGVVATNQTASVTISNGDGQPSFKKVLLIKNTGSQANRPKNSIVIWIGTIANIPSGYVLCDGTNSTPDLRDYFIKGALNASELGNTGGSSQHNHTATSSHNHTQDSHTHSVSLGAASGTTTGTYTTVSSAPSTTHSHAGVNITGTATNQATTITVDNCASETAYPPYYEVAFIMQNKILDIGGASLLQMMM